MSRFGWSYPPGAANDPSAPYNQDYPDVVVLKDRVQKATKDHKCEFCQQTIPRGDKYRYIVVKDYDNGGKVTGSHQHIACPYEEEWP